MATESPLTELENLLGPRLFGVKLGNPPPTANLRSEIWRVDGDAEVLSDGELVTSAVKNPASIAFGRGPAYNPCSIYVTGLDGDRIVRVAIGSRGAELKLLG